MSAHSTQRPSSTHLATCDSYAALVKKSSRRPAAPIISHRKLPKRSGATPARSKPNHSTTKPNPRKRGSSVELPQPV